MTEFIYGVQNTGKSTLVYKRIREDLASGKKVVLIVPDQEALTAEAELAAVCSDVPTYDLKVYGFSRLADDVFRTYGGICYDYVDKTGATLAMYLSLCSVSQLLTVYKNVTAADGSLLTEMLSTVRGFKRQGITAEDLDRAAGEELPKQLKSKLQDLSKIYAAYGIAMAKCGDDPDDDTARMYKILSEHGGFAGTSVYIDSFISFTGVQFKVVELIMKTADKLTVTIGAPAKGERVGSVLSPVYETEKKLRAAALRYTGATYTELTERYAAPELNALEEALRGCGGVYEKDCERIRVFSARTAYEEADAVAADIKKRITEGCRCRDFAILTEDLQSRKGIIDAALEKYGIPYFISVRSDARQRSLFRMIQSAINVYTGNFRPEDVSAYARCGLIGLSDNDLDLFGDYIRRYKVRKADNYIKDFSLISYSSDQSGNERTAEKLKRINDVRAYVVTPLYDFCQACSECEDAKSITDAIIKLLAAAGVPQTLRKLYKEYKDAGELSEAQETAQLFDVFLKVTSQIKTLCAGISMRPAQYAALLDTVLSQTSIGKIPTCIDEVIVGESGMLRARGIKHVYVIGANEGEFPAAVTDTGLLDDKEKEDLLSIGIELESDSEKEMNRKAYDFYRCACLPSESVTFSYCRLGMENTGSEKKICGMLEYALKAFKNVPTFTEQSADVICSSEEAAFEYCAEHPDTDEGRALFKIFSEKEGYGQRLSALSEPIRKEEEVLSKETVDALIPASLRISPTKLEKFISCSLLHCCRYYLELEEDDEVSFSNIDFGVLIHLILQKFTEDYIKDNSLADLSDNEIYKRTVELMDSYFEDKLGIDLGKPGSGRLRAQILRLCKAAVKAVKEIYIEFKTGRFRPFMTELAIYENGPVPPVVIDVGDGRTVRLTGKIDRVDVYEDGGKTYVKLVDYKTGRVDHSQTDLEDMKKIQLYIYMIDAKEKIGDLPSPDEGALYYMQTFTPPRPAKDAAELASAEPLSRAGVARSDEKVLTALGPAVVGPDKTTEGDEAGKIALRDKDGFDSILDTVKSKVAEKVLKMTEGKLSPAKVEGDTNACKYCGFMPFCRYTEMKGRKY